MDVLQPYEPSRPVTGISLPFYLTNVAEHVNKWIYSKMQDRLKLHLSIYLSIYLSICFGRFFSFLIYTESVGLLGRGSARRKAATYTQTQNKRT
jgi:hypothetical protein